MKRKKEENDMKKKKKKKNQTGEEPGLEVVVTIRRYVLQLLEDP